MLNPSPPSVLGNQDEGFFAYSETRDLATRWPQAKAVDRILFPQRQLEGIDLRGAHYQIRASSNEHLRLR